MRILEVRLRYERSHHPWVSENSLRGNKPMQRIQKVHLFCRNAYFLPVFAKKLRLSSDLPTIVLQQCANNGYFFGNQSGLLFDTWVVGHGIYREQEFQFSDCLLPGQSDESQQRIWCVAVYPCGGVLSFRCVCCAELHVVQSSSKNSVCLLELVTNNLASGGSTSSIEKKANLSWRFAVVAE